MIQSDFVGLADLGFANVLVVDSLLLLVVVAVLFSESLLSHHWIWRTAQRVANSYNKPATIHSIAFGYSKEYQVDLRSTGTFVLGRP